MRPPMKFCCPEGANHDPFAPHEKAMLAIGPAAAALLFSVIVVLFHLL